MSNFRIKIVKPESIAPHFAIVKAPSFDSAAYYAIEIMLLAPYNVSLSEHLKINSPLSLEVKARTNFIFEFNFRSELRGKNKLFSNVKIILDNEAKPKIDYNIEPDEPIIDFIERINKPISSVYAIKFVPFFTIHDLEYFTSVSGKRYRKGQELNTIKTQLLNGVFNKTKYWAELLKEKGFLFEFRNDWQHSGQIRKYSWARIYLNGYLNKNVFFTIGAGSRYTEFEEMEHRLEYKLDCRRDELAKEQILFFDDYIGENCPGAARQIIEIEDFELFNWEKLVNQTISFIETYANNYKEVLALLQPIDRAKKLARVCWNENGWEEPSGPKGKSKTKKDTFENENGYGYEEWLFNTRHQIDGYHYSFLQQFNKGDHVNNIYDVKLYSYYNTKFEKTWYWIGRIKNLEVITSDEANYILSLYKKKGWYDEMLTQLREFNISGFNYGSLKDNFIFNVKYKIDSNNYVRFDPYKIIENPSKEISSNYYVLLNNNNDENNISSNLSFIEGHNIEGKKGLILTSPTGSYTKTLTHRNIQDHVYLQLKDIYKDTNIKVGTEQETGCGTSVDLVVNDPVYGYTFYEIKTGFSGLSCIRSALGQLFEYCYYPNKKQANKLIIVAPFKIDVAIKMYMKHLREILSIEVYYQYFSLETNTLDMKEA